MRLVFMGTAPFAVPCLRALVSSGNEVAAVVTQPDRPRGRGMALQPSAVKVAAAEHGLAVIQPERASEPAFIAGLRELRPECVVVVAYGQILRPALLEIPPLGCINVHGSLLPELRGAAPIQWSLIRGFAETGVTTMFMDAGMDTGDMILKHRVPIAPNDTAGDLTEKLAPAGAELLKETLALVAGGDPPREAQDSSLATYARMLRKEDGVVSWNVPASEVRGRIHGCNPSPGAYTVRAGSQVKLWRAEVVPGTRAAAPGTVLDAHELIIACAPAALRLLEVQPESRGRLDGGAYGRGYRVAAGEVWG